MHLHFYASILWILRRIILHRPPFFSACLRFFSACLYFLYHASLQHAWIPYSIFYSLSVSINRAYFVRRALFPRPFLRPHLNKFTPPPIFWNTLFTSPIFLGSFYRSHFRIIFWNHVLRSHLNTLPSIFWNPVLTSLPFLNTSYFLESRFYIAPIFYF